MKDKKDTKTQFASVDFTRLVSFQSFFFFVKTLTDFPHPSVGS